MAGGSFLGSDSGGGSFDGSVLGSLLAFYNARISDFPVGESGFCEDVDCLAPEWAVLSFRAEVHEVVMVGKSLDAEVFEAVFVWEVLEVFSEDLVEEGLLPTNPGGFLHRMAVTVTTS